VLYSAGPTSVTQPCLRSRRGEWRRIGVHASLEGRAGQAPPLRRAGLVTVQGMHAASLRTSVVLALSLRVRALGTVVVDPPSPRLVLSALPKLRLADLGRELGVLAPDSLSKDAQLDALLPALPPLPDLVARLGRDELRAVCRALSLDDRARARAELAARILGTTADRRAGAGGLGELH